MNFFKILIQLMLLVLPWPFRRMMLSLLFGYQLHEKSYIGWSIILADQVCMSSMSRIGHLNLCKSIDYLILEEDAGIGNMNFITGFSKRKFPFLFSSNRVGAVLIMRKSSALTSRHFVDTNGSVEIKEFTTVAGLRSLILTHSINPKTSRQECAPVIIGKNNFVGTCCIFLPGSSTGERNLIQAGSVISKLSPCVDDAILSGNPATKVKDIDPCEYKYFERVIQFVD